MREERQRQRGWWEEGLRKEQEQEQRLAAPHPHLLPHHCHCTHYGTRCIPQSASKQRYSPLSYPLSANQALSLCERVRIFCCRSVLFFVCSTMLYVEVLMQSWTLRGQKTLYHFVVVIFEKTAFFLQVEA
jgi:hypothetical protein